jgi:hypothetical protein
MITFFKYFSVFIVFVSLVLSYLLLSTSGNARLYHYLSQTFSEKTDLIITVHHIDMHDFPKVVALMNVDNKANLIVKGVIGLHRLKLDYTFTSDPIKYASTTIDDDFHIDGQVTGQYNNMYVTGHGTFLGGNIVYETTKRTDRIEDLLITMKNIDSQKLFKRMGQKTLINGKADVKIAFTFMDKVHRDGYFTYDVKDNNFSGIPISLHTKVNIKDKQHTFIIDIKAPSLSLEVRDGKYDLEKKLAKASYILDIKDLAALKTFLGYKYLGVFKAKGEIIYKDRLSITGYSNSYGGVIDYHLENDGLIIGLNGVSFKSLVSIFPYEPILTASATGNIFYNFIEKSIVINSTLKNSKLLKSNFTKNIYKKSHVEMTKETFKYSTLDAGYQNGIFSAEVKLGDEKNHAYLKNTIINIDKNTISTYFDFKLQKKSFTGKVYGNYNNPTVNLNTKEAIEYHFTQRFDSILGKKNRENVEKFVNAFPLGNNIKDMASEAAASIVNMFF